MMMKCEKCLQLADRRAFAPRITIDPGRTQGVGGVGPILAAEHGAGGGGDALALGDQQLGSFGAA